MPRTTITPETMVGGGDDRFPALKLKLAEVARGWLPPEPGTQTHQPWREWVHSIEAPVIEHGVAKQETKERLDKTTYLAYVTSFINNPICLGDFETMKARGVDVDMCPACEAAQRLGKKEFKAKIRYASIFIKYAVKQNSVEIASPFSATPLIWAYPAGRAKILSDIFKGEGRDLCMYDLSLGPAQPPEHFQKYDIRALGSRVPAWKEHLPYMKELLTTEGNMPTDEDLQRACGRIIERKYIEEDLRRAEHLWAIADGIESGPATVGAEFNGGGTLGEGLEDLLGSAGAPAPASPPPVEAPAQDQPTADELSQLMGTPAAAPAPAGDVFPTVEAPAPAEQGETVSFDDLLGPA